VSTATCIHTAHNNNSKNLVIGQSNGFLQLFDLTIVELIYDASNHIRRKMLRKEPTYILKTLPPIQSINIRQEWKPQKDWITDILAVPSLSNSIITSSMDGSIAISNINSQAEYRLLKGHKKPIYSIDYSDRYKIIASCGRDRAILFWNPSLNKPLATIKTENSPIIKVAFNEKDSRIIGIFRDRVVRIWDIRTYKLLQTLDDNQLDNAVDSTDNKDPFTSASYDPVSNTIVAADSQILTWNVSFYLR
jgi:WD40 repeat protein